VRVEAHVRPGLPGMTIVGLPGVAVREARERVRSGAASAGLPLPAQRMTVNLSPADLRKEGPGLDLPVALALLAAAGRLPAGALDSLAAHGEVALDGLVRPVRGVLSVAETAGKMGVKTLLLPVTALPEAAAVGHVDALGVRSLAEAVAAAADPRVRERLRRRGQRWLQARSAVPPVVSCYGSDMAEVAGLRHPKRALELAAAGGHHLLLVGSPGAGKTMLARRVPSILPPLTRDESLEVTRIWSVAGLHPPESGLICSRPLRAPHHTASRSALVGGGSLPRPGEVSLAHRGVLFLDELPEFSRDSVEALRQPLEDGTVTVSRRSGSCTFQAACTLVAAMNPCPCGFHGHPQRMCRCAAEAQQRYRQVLTGPLGDRIDLMVEVPPLTGLALDEDVGGESSAVVRARVLTARAFRARRESGCGVSSSSSSTRPHPRLLERRLCMSGAGGRLLREALVRNALGGRGYVRVLAVSRTLADLVESEIITQEHVAEALALRLDVVAGILT
jgi:magnesium chelatase family protein